jgi:hypothetical protein
MKAAWDRIQQEEGSKDVVEELARLSETLILKLSELPAASRSQTHIQGPLKGHTQRPSNSTHIQRPLKVLLCACEICACDKRCPPFVCVGVCSTARDVGRRATGQRGGGLPPVSGIGTHGGQAHRAALSVRSPDTPRRQTNAAARDPASAPATASNHVDMASKQLDLSVCVCVQDYALKPKA